MKRWIRMGGYLALLVVLIWYGKAYNPAITLAKCMADPQKYDGTTINIGTEIIVREVLSDGFIVEQMGIRVPVKGEVTGVKGGQYVALSAVFHAPGWLELKQLYIAKGRRGKIVVSLLPLGIVVLVLVRRYRFDFRRLVIFERSYVVNVKGKCKIPSIFTFMVKG